MNTREERFLYEQKRNEKSAINKKESENSEKERESQRERERERENYDEEDFRVSSAQGV